MSLSFYPLQYSEHPIVQYNEMGPTNTIITLPCRGIWKYINMSRKKTRYGFYDVQDRDKINNTLKLSLGSAAHILVQLGADTLQVENINIQKIGVRLLPSQKNCWDTLVEHAPWFADAIIESRNEGVIVDMENPNNQFVIFVPPKPHAYAQKTFDPLRYVVHFPSTDVAHNYSALGDPLVRGNPYLRTISGNILHVTDFVKRYFIIEEFSYLKTPETTRQSYHIITRIAFNQPISVNVHLDSVASNGIIYNIGIKWL